MRFTQAQLAATVAQAKAKAANSPRWIRANDRAAASRASLIAGIKAAWARRFPDVSMADELLRRFRVNYLEALADDMLRGVLAACALMQLSRLAWGGNQSRDRLPKLI